MRFYYIILYYMAKNEEGKKLISIVVPAYNESAGIVEFYTILHAALSRLSKYDYEVIFVDDGSHDDTRVKIGTLAKKDHNIRLICLSRNFGKEIATTAGIHKAFGDATLILDADGQHPVDLIPEFINKWEKGAKVVVGVRIANQKEGLVKRYGSKLFYIILNRVTDLKMTPSSTDFRLIDRTVQTEFDRLTERNRITRGLIDWLGYKREYITFIANPRMAGEASYSIKKLLQLAIDSVISSSTSPLYLASYLGAAITSLSLFAFILMIIDALLGDPVHLHATGSAYGILVVLLLVGILLISQGIIGLYLAHIHVETKNRPLYVIDEV